MELKDILRKILLFILNIIKDLIENILNLKENTKNNEEKNICPPEIKERVQNYLNKEISSFKKEALNYFLTQYKERVDVLEEDKIFEKYEKRFTQPFFGLSFRDLNYFEEECLYHILQKTINSNLSGRNLIKEYEKILLKEAEKEAIEFLKTFPTYSESSSS